MITLLVRDDLRLGGTNCLTLLVQRRFSSNTVNSVATYDDP